MVPEVLLLASQRQTAMLGRGHMAGKAGLIYGRRRVPSWPKARKWVTPSNSHRELNLTNNQWIRRGPQAPGKTETLGKPWFQPCEASRTGPSKHVPGLWWNNRKHIHWSLPPVSGRKLLNSLEFSVWWKCLLLWWVTAGGPLDGQSLQVRSAPEIMLLRASISQRLRRQCAHMPQAPCPSGEESLSFVFSSVS